VRLAQAEAAAKQAQDKDRASAAQPAPMAQSPLDKALAAAVGGFVIAHHADYPPGQTTVAILCLLLILAWLYQSTVSIALAPRKRLRSLKVGPLFRP